MKYMTYTCRPKQYKMLLYHWQKSSLWSQYLALFVNIHSTLDSGLNAMTAVTLVDVIKPYRKWRGQKKDAPDMSLSTGNLGKYSPTAPPLALEEKGGLPRAEELSGNQETQSDSNSVSEDPLDRSYDIILIKILSRFKVSQASL